MKILIAPDKFKGTISAEAAATTIADAIRMFRPDFEVRTFPIADGGEGTAKLLMKAAGGTIVRSQASDPLLRPVSCEYGISADGSTAFIDIAEASGLKRLAGSEVNAMRTSTIGTGELIASAVSRRCSKIIVGLGGSATMDCGIGIAHALGVKFLDDERKAVSPIGSHLGKIEFIDSQHRRFLPGAVELIFLADVVNPLLGDDGAVMYAAQKGIEGERVHEIHAGMSHYSQLLEAEYGLLPKTPGMGAAGGAAFSCLALMGAKLAPGADYLLQVLNAEAAIAEADLIITGEGHLDLQSLRGKAPISIARVAQKQGKQVAAICGKISLDASQLREAGIQHALALVKNNSSEVPDADKTLELLRSQTVALLRKLATKLKQD